MGKFGEIDSADTRAGKFRLVPMGGWAEGPACADTGARTPIDPSGNLFFITCPLSLTPISFVYCPCLGHHVLYPLSVVLCPLSFVICPLSSVLCPFVLCPFVLCHSSLILFSISYEINFKKCLIQHQNSKRWHSNQKSTFYRGVQHLPYAGLQSSTSSDFG